MTRVRGFMVVLHDAPLGEKSVVHMHLKSKYDPQEYVVAQEEYPTQPGHFHIHIFYKFTEKVTFLHHLKHWVHYWKYGRVQVDQMRGTIVSSCKYLMKDFTQKEKHVDPAPIIFTRVNKDRQELGLSSVFNPDDDTLEVLYEVGLNGPKFMRYLEETVKPQARIYYLRS